MPETPPIDEFDPERLFVSLREEESLFARGDDDALVRYVKPSLAQFEEKVTLVIDGILAKDIRKATPLTDALGNPRRGPDGNFIPRSTTIYDAALELVQRGEMSADDLRERIPILCHQQHLNPVAVCRMCSVHISSIKRGKFTGGRKLVPACQHRVEDKMAVLSRQGPRDIDQFLQVLSGEFKIKTEDLPKEKTVRDYAKMVGDSTGFLSELLVADHLHPDPERGDRYENELSNVAESLGGGANRFSTNPLGEQGRNRELHAKSRPMSIPLNVISDRRGQNWQSAVEDDADKFEPDPLFPYSSRSVHVDHDRCILCDRCVRSCSEVKPFKVIGHTGKGYRTRISFDLDRLMDESSCVQCGECMTACPTGALTLNRRVSPRSWPDHPDPKKPWISPNPAAPLPESKGFLTAAEMREVELFYEEQGKERSFFPFRDIPYPYLLWNEGAVRRRVLKAGGTLCKQGDFGSTAYLLVEGKFLGTLEKADAEGALTSIRSLFRGSQKSAKEDPIQFFLSAKRDLILGEMACLTNGKRNATVTATTPAIVLEITRNMLTMLQRNPAARRVLDNIYCRRAIYTCLSNAPLFRGLPAERRGQVVAEFEKDAEVIRVEPGQVIVAEGDRIGYDEKGVFHGDLYIVLLGFVKVSKKYQKQERVLAHLTKDQYFGEIALLPDHPRVQRAREQWGINPFQRTATCSALADVEVVRIPGETFRRFFRPEEIQDKNDPFAKIADKLAEITVNRLLEQANPPDLESDRLGDYLDQGLYQSQKMLVLDLLSCTRCDECTKACADAHGDGHSRLLREGLRFGDFLVAASCRSCHQPYCMDGCPVDAIHRDPKSPEILIEDHCIGCSLCERNCPYGSIQMVPKERGKIWSDLLADVIDDPQLTAAVPRRAVNCDLCHDLIKPGKEPFCVSACPHKAAFRWDGPKLMKEVNARNS